MPDDALGWVGATIDGRYAVEEVVGEGGQGVVYRARHLGFEEPVALKCLKLGSRLATSARETLVAAFRAEARLLHRLSRKTTGIVQALDIGAATSPRGQWSPFIAMEWLAGESLESWLERREAQRHAALGPVEAVRWLAPAARALAVAHASGVAHLDVKPGNLFCTIGAEPTLKILDFGIAKVLSGSESLSRALCDTGATLRLFTPAYAAPEQFQARHGARGPWTDVFALALILVELVSGRRALGHGDPAGLYAASADERHRPSLAAHGVAAPDLDRVLARALAVDPEERHRAAGSFWREVEGALGERHAAPSRPADPDAAHPHPRVAASPPPARPPPSSSASTVLADHGTRTTGENRFATVMVASVGGFAELCEQLEPEQVKYVADHCFGLLTSCIEELGGHVERYVGDALIAVFGFERASDDDAERAVLAALDMQRIVAGLGLPQRVLGAFRFRLTIGIEVGRIFVGQPARGSASITGEPVNVAARLQAAARDGTVLVGRDACRLVAGAFVIERVGPVARPHAREPLGAFWVVGLAPPRHGLATPAFHGLDTGFFGRGPELARLDELFETVLEERCARLVTLVGNPGLGKSRLLSELAPRVAGRALLWTLQAGMLSARRGGTIAAFLRAPFHIHEDDPPEVIDHKLRRLVRRLRERGNPARETRASTRPPLDSEEIVTVLGRALAARAPMDEPSVVSDEAVSQGRQRLAAAVAALLASAGAAVLLCDDIHNLDGALLALLDDIVLRLHDAPFLVLCSARPTLYEKHPLWGEGKPAHARLDLEPLPRRHLEQIVRDRLRHVGSVPEALVRRLCDHAEGSPLALEETLHLLVDAGLLEPREHGAWTLHDGAVGELGLPATVQGIAQARIDRLSAEERETLVRAAVVGRTFWDGAVLELCADAPALDAAAALERLRSRGMVRARDTSVFPGEREYVFSEASVHRVAYEALSLKLRRRLHHLAAGWLEPRSSDAGAALLARHAELAGDLAGAARAYERAGRNAAALAQHESAVDCFGHAARIEERTRSGAEEPVSATMPLPLESPSESRVLSWRERARLQLALGDVLRRAGRVEEAERSYAEARERVLVEERRTDDDLDVAEAAAWLARVEHRVALVKQVRGDLEQAQALVESALARAPAAALFEEVPAMWALSAALHSRRQALDACLAASLRGLRVCRAIHRRDDRFRASVSELMVTLGSVFFRRRKLVQAARCYAQAARFVDARVDPYQASRALNNLAATRFLQSEIAAAREAFGRVLELSERSGDLAMTMTAHSNLAESESRLGRPEAARRHARTAVRLGEHMGATGDLPEIHRNLAESARALGAHDEAVAAARRALELGRAEAGRVYLAGVAETVARVCAAARVAAVDVTSLVTELEQALATDLATPHLEPVARRCRTLLAGGS
jgi:class 3 adenylate cyclase/tetratricopeptide (TPR) repeat protein